MADPICTFVFSILVLASTITVLKDFSVLLMEGRSDFIIILGSMSSLLYNHKKEWPQGMLTVNLHYRENINLQGISVKTNMSFIHMGTNKKN